jgi:ABC-type amino acid transport substrate-binding protein
MARRTGTALEINAHTARLDLDDINCMRAKEKGGMVAIGNEDFRDELNIVLEEFFDDGTYWAIYDRYFSEEPWSLDQMINEPPVDR